jgi:flagellar protein FliO/FliZ
VPPASDTLPGLADGLSQTILGLVAVLALIALLAWAARRLSGRLQGRGGALELLGGLSLGARERLILVRVDGIRFLVGVAPGSVRALHVFDQVADSATAHTSSGTFGEALNSQREHAGGRS